MINKTLSTPIETQLAPSYLLAIVLIITAIPLILIQIWISAIVALFGLFLMYQAATIRLRFTQTALDIYRSNTLIRKFPYQDWINWEIFWPRIPILFYFREVKSIHFLPILFDPLTLKTCLEERCNKK